MPGKKAAKDARRAQILRAGHQVASRVGLDRLTVRLVAAKARLSSGLVHFYFKTKERLLAALLVDVLKTTPVRHITQDIAWMKSPLGRLRTLLGRELKRIFGDPRRIRLFFEYLVRGFRQPLIRANIAADLRKQRDAFLPTAEALLASDPDRFPNVTAEGIAAVAVGVIEGAAVQSVADPKHFDADGYAAAAKGLLEPPHSNAS